MLSETSKDTKCYPSHTIYQKIVLEVVENLLSVVAACNTFILCWAWEEIVLGSLPSAPGDTHRCRRDGAIAEVEQFVCHLYGAPDVTGGVVGVMRQVGHSLSWRNHWSHCLQPLTTLNYTCREPITKPKYGFRQTDATCHWDVQQTQEDGRKQMVS